ncbi:MAG: AAA family ATPase [bacterium]|nr:AAA family ATPase [bacterium]
MTNDKETVKEIPYGIADYALIRSENYYYVDKTSYLPALKKAGRYLLFIRPRRFGKSLFVSLLGTYHDVHYKDRFDEFFKGTWIYENPTDEKGQYLVLVFNFANVAPTPAKVDSSFLDHVRGRVLKFIQKYKNYFSTDDNLDYFKKTINESDSASDILSNLLLLTQTSNLRLYLIIDEYDNFANTILTTAGKDAYEGLTQGEGFLRSFFNVVKGGTTDTEAPISRVFITGVSPITMDDVTSGYNIGLNVTMEPSLNRMLGFTEEDITDMIEYYRSKGMVGHPVGELFAIMKQWYGNYRFTQYDETRLFNSDMVLYFMNSYLDRQTLPEDLIDRNVRVDYGKLKHLIIVDRDYSGKSIKPAVNGNFSKLWEIIESGETVSKIVKGFPLEELTDTANFISLLFYFGLLTIESSELDQVVLRIPNETVRRLYYDYLKKGYEETDIFAIDFYRYGRLMKELAMKGEWRPLFDYITGLMRESMSLRELMTGEKSVQAFLNIYLGLSNFYIIHTEKEMNKGFADIIMEPFIARYESLKYAYMVELKYIKSGAKADDPEVLRLKEEAEKQLKQYGLDKKFGKAVEKTQLKKLVLIFSGHDALYMDEVTGI